MVTIRRLAGLASRGAIVGAVAALVVAFGDFGASFLWLPWWPDRLGLLWRLPATQVPIGATVGAVLFVVADTWGAALDRWARTGDPSDATAARARGRVWPLPFVLLSAPPLTMVAVKLFEGGTASHLPARDLLVATAALMLIGGTYLALRLGRALALRLREAPTPRALAAGAALFVVYLGLSKIDQNVYPKLYEYLHALLSAAGFFVVAFGLGLVAVHLPRAQRFVHARPRWGLGLLVVLWVLLAVDLTSLDANQNVRVAMFDPRAASSRSLMQALDPMLRRANEGTLTEARARARRARERRRGASVAGLPEWPDAHVLLVTIDALRADHLGAYGYGRRISEHIDALARDSVVFDHAYAAAPHSSYSLCSLMTSEYLHEVVDIGRPLPSATLPRALNDAGVFTAGLYTNGIFHTEGDRVKRYHDHAFGFALHDHSDLKAEKKTDQALETIDRIVQDGEPPSFMWVHYFDVHEPYRERSLGSSAMDRYDGEIRNVDRALDRLLREAKKRLHRKLIVIVTADHGEEFRDHGGLYHGSSLYQEQIRVPLIVHAPGLAPAHIEAPVELVDVAPTVLGSLGVPVPSSMRGSDLRALMVGKVHDVGPAFGAVMQKRMVVRWPYKLIADLRYDLFELYDLEHDPNERHNLANKKPALVDDLRGEIYAWLDSLQRPAGDDANLDPRQVAIDRGSLGDHRALEPLAALLRDETAPASMRCEAARLLGDLGDTSVSDELARTMHSPDPRVAAEAAIALGRLYDTRARRMLRDLVYSEDVDLRTRAAVSLGRLRDAEAVPALVQAMSAAKTKDDRREAIRWLGRLRDRRAVQPLLSMLGELRVRNLVLIALGEIGDPTTYDTVMDVLRWEHRPTIRDDVARALGQIGNPDAIGRLVSMSLAEPDLGQVSESLVRLGAPERGAVGGTDVGPSTTGLAGFGKCHASPKHQDWGYAGRTWCATAGHRAALRAPVPASVRDAQGAVAVLRVRRLDRKAPVEVSVRLGDRELGVFDVGGDWKEKHFTVRATDLRGSAARVHITADDRGARLGVDHFLLIPRPAHLAAR